MVRKRQISNEEIHFWNFVERNDKVPADYDLLIDEWSNVSNAEFCYKL